MTALVGWLRAVGDQIALVDFQLGGIDVLHGPVVVQPKGALLLVACKHTAW